MEEKKFQPKKLSLSNTKQEMLEAYQVAFETTGSPEGSRGEAGKEDLRRKRQRRWFRLLNLSRPKELPRRSAI